MILIGERIKELRKKYKYTQTELADLLGITKSTIAAYENNSRFPSYEVLIKMSKLFMVSTDYLLLNSTGKQILEVDGLTLEQLEMIEKMIINFRNYNAMEKYIEEYKIDKDKYAKRMIQYNDAINNSNIFKELDKKE